MSKEIEQAIELINSKKAHEDGNDDYNTGLDMAIAMIRHLSPKEEQNEEINLSELSIADLGALFFKGDDENYIVDWSTRKSAERELALRSSKINFNK